MRKILILFCLIFCLESTAQVNNVIQNDTSIVCGDTIQLEALASFTIPSAPDFSLTTTPGSQNNPHIDISSSGPLSNILVGQDFTIEAWVKRNNTLLNALDRIYSKDYVFMFRYVDSLFVGSVGNYSVTTPFPNDTMWHHLVFQRNTGLDRLELYVDGFLEESIEDSSDIIINNQALETIGARNDGSIWEQFSGSISMVRVSSVVRYSSNFQPACSMLSDSVTSALWILTDATNGAVLDQSNNSYDGVAVGLQNYSAYSCDGSVNYQWSTSNVGSIVNVSLSQSTMIYCLASMNGQTAIDSVLVTVNPLNINLSGQTGVAASSNASYQIQNPPSGISVIWSITGGALIFGQGSGLIDVEWGSGGVGEVTAIVNRGECSDTANLQVDIWPVSVEGVFTKQSIAVYPNPTKDIINITSKEQVSISLYNIFGQPMVDRQDANKLDMSSYPSGFYFLKLWNKNGDVFETIQINKL